MFHRAVHCISLTLVLCIGCFVTVNGQGSESLARKLARFETGWLTANLNGDGSRLERQIAGEQIAMSALAESTHERERLTKQLLDVDVPDGAMKVRISGLISFLTNDPAKNRSFNFLDTFNRRGGKWEVIASSFSPTSAAPSDSKGQVEKEIRILEMEAAKAILDKNEAAIARFFTVDSVTNNPRNSLTRGSAGVIEAAKTGLINYHSFERVIESVQVLGNTVVVMGNETVVMKDRAGAPGETIKRRYTNVWMKTGENWQIVARHASVINIASSGQ